jgi:dihydroneopterin aldolase
MALMLACVTNAADAVKAIALGSDLVEFEASHGDATTTHVIAEAVQQLGGGAQVSVDAGDAPLSADGRADWLSQMQAYGAHFTKFVIDDAATLPAVPASMRAMATFFPDTMPSAETLRRLAAVGFSGAWLDMKRHAAGRLLDHCDISALHGFSRNCREAGLIAGLAGGLATPDIPRLLQLAPSILGFRRALYGANGLDPARLRAVRGMIPEPSNADERVEAAYRSSPDACDLVLVNDFVLPVFIGAYAHEHAEPQRVRFAVAASLLQGSRPAGHMRDVFSYDLITDGIRLIVADGHIALVETLAERIAELVLSHRRVMKVRVRVEKLDTGSGHVGIEIERARV